MISIDLFIIYFNSLIIKVKKIKFSQNNIFFFDLKMII
jgi:hypothetical protein